ncbi:MAG: KAP family NTPase [Streptococcaceae bacterium]|jgi:hypothetical protein|nr:KAP family NTPase [Streptococcaceae bacterium]
MRETEQAIRNYLGSDINLAIQLDGGWGSGKTFFVKELVKDLNKDDFIHAIYFSLYGTTTLEEIKLGIVEKIISETLVGGKLITFYQKHKEKINGLNRIFGNSRLKPIGTILDLISEAYRDRSNELSDKKIVIFIDDLERRSKGIQLADLFGFISAELLENLHIKVVIISNAEKLEDEKYETIKEKTIERSINFSCEWETVKEVVKTGIDGLQILKDGDWLFEVIKIFLYGDGKINLRILQSVLSNYKFLEEKIMAQKIGKYESQESDICKSIFLNTLVITNEMKLGRLDSSKLKEISNLCDSRIFLTEEMAELNGLTEKREIKISKLASEIIKKYHYGEIFTDYIFYSDSINNYIIRGYFEESPSVYINKWLKYFDVIEYQTSNLLSQIAYQFDQMVEEELRNIQDKIIVEIHNARFPSLEELIKTYFQLAQFSKMGLMFSGIEEDWRKAFISTGTLAAVAQKEEIIPEFELNHFWQRYEDFVMRDDYNWIHMEYKKIEIEDRSIKEKEAIVSIFQKNTTQAQRTVLDNLSSQKVVNRIAEGGYIENFVMKVPSGARELWFYLRNANRFDNDPEDLQIIIDKIEKEKSKIIDKVALYGIKELLDYLKENQRQELLAKEGK